VAFGLVRAVLESHGLEGAAAERAADELILRPDQVLLGSEEAPLVVAALERAGVDSVRVRPVLAGSGRASGGGEAEPEPHWQRAAVGLGMLIPRPGQGEIENLHGERLAGPGRLMLCTGRLPASGAFGMLALGVDALVAAAVLAGGPHTRRSLSVLGVDLTGVLPGGTCGVDLALALLLRLREVGEGVEVIEFGGPGVTALSMADRVGAAWLLAEAGLPALFPSDETTRAELEALKREQEWRRLEASEDGTGGVWRLDLAALEALVAPLDDLGAARPAHTLEGTAVGRVLAGPGATLEDLARIASQLEGRRVHPHVECTVVAGSRALLDRAAECGLVERLASAGVCVVEGQVSAHAAGAGTGLCVGVPLRAVASGRGRWLVAGAECVGAAARAGALVRPWPGEAGVRPTSGPGSGLAGDPWMPGAGESNAPAASAAPREAGGGAPALRGASRGEVLAVLGDDVESIHLIPSGARLEDLRSRLSSLASQMLSGRVPGFAKRARERSGGFLVAGREFARGEPRAAAALCLEELGVRAVLAASYAPGAARTLVHAGVIPLLGTAEGGPQVLECGDELELPGLLDGLVPARPLVARNLTRGTHLSLRHDLSARQIAILRAGGLLPFVVGGARLPESR
jgi:aconitate hydratase